MSLVLTSSSWGGNFTRLWLESLVNFYCCRGFLLPNYTDLMLVDVQLRVLSAQQQQSPRAKLNRISNEIEMLNKLIKSRVSSQKKIVITSSFTFIFLAITSGSVYLFSEIESILLIYSSCHPKSTWPWFLHFLSTRQCWWWGGCFWEILWRKYVTTNNSDLAMSSLSDTLECNHTRLSMPW